MKKQEQVYINFRNVVLIIGLALVAYILQMMATIPFTANPFMLAFFSTGAGMLLGGTFYVLVMRKAPYRGTILLYTFVPSIMLLFMGTPYVVLVFVVGALIAEAIFWKNPERSIPKLYMSYAIYATFWGLGTYLPAYLQKDALLEKVTATGGGEELFAAYDKLYTLPYVSLSVVIAIVCSILGVFIGTKIFKKHFAKI